MHRTISPRRGGLPTAPVRTRRTYLCTTIGNKGTKKSKSTVLSYFILPFSPPTAEVLARVTLLLTDKTALGVFGRSVAYCSVADSFYKKKQYESFKSQRNRGVTHPSATSSLCDKGPKRDASIVAIRSHGSSRHARQFHRHNRAVPQFWHGLYRAAHFTYLPHLIIYSRGYAKQQRYPSKRQHRKLSHKGIVPRLSLPRMTR